ncbi:hypothetical protein RFI_14810, partial [Reticulomyxa filosa]
MTLDCVTQLAGFNNNYNIFQTSFYNNMCNILMEMAFIISFAVIRVILVVKLKIFFHYRLSIKNSAQESEKFVESTHMSHENVGADGVVATTPEDTVDQVSKRVSPKAEDKSIDTQINNVLDGSAEGPQPIQNQAENETAQNNVSPHERDESATQDDNNTTTEDNGNGGAEQQELDNNRSLENDIDFEPSDPTANEVIAAEEEEEEENANGLPIVQEEQEYENEALTQRLGKKLSIDNGRCFSFFGES